MLAALPLPGLAGVEGDAEKMFEQMKEKIPISNNERARYIVECVTSSIIAVLPEKYAEDEWEVVLFDQPSVNAFAMPGGKIGVFMGIFGVARDQNALAAVIGHEIAHVTSRHAQKRATRKTLTGIAAGVATVLIGANAPVNGQTMRTVNSALNMGAELGLNRPYDRGQESEADIVGLDYMARAGFDPRESITLWKAMETVGGNGPPEFISTHPSGRTRISDLIGGLPGSLATYNAAREAGVIPDCH
ncbi:MAG: M48 family metallopeptidase [Gammaproteobacteria bacterium]|nr:M48 family metallopeptidase [Gammaproteobacteria bacterium]